MSNLVISQKALSQIVNEAVSIEQMLIESGGELTPEIQAALSVNADQLAEKVDGYHSIMERFKDLSVHYAARARFFEKISEQCDGVIDKLRANVIFAMDKLGSDEIKGQDVRFKLTLTSGSLKITDKEMIPVEFKEEVITTEIKKDELKEAIKKDKEIKGAEVVYSKSLRVYANLPDKKSKAKELKNV